MRGFPRLHEFPRLRRFFARISFRLLAFNLLLVFVPAAGILYLDIYERQLLAALEDSMVQQGRVLAAALGERGGVDPVLASSILQRLEQRLTARLRVLDRQGWVVADSSLLGPRLEPAPVLPKYLSQTTSSVEEAELAAARDSPFYRLGSAMYGLYRRLLGAPEAPLAAVEPFPVDQPIDIGPVRAALEGRYRAATRISPGQRSATLFSGIPIRSDGRVVGVVLVSATTLRILTDLYQVRTAVFKVVLAALAMALLLTTVSSLTIVRPLRRLQGEALTLVDRRGRLRGTFGGSDRADEIGDLARALEDLSRRLAEHMSFVEAFAGDVSHELKNPLASIRNAAEMLEDALDPADRRAFHGIVRREIARMEHLLDEMREMARLDAEVGADARPTVLLEELLPALVDGVRRRSPPGVAVEIEPAIDHPLLVRASPDRVAQVIENLLDNAMSFAPAGTAVTVRMARIESNALVVVSDRGPGIPPQHLEKIFARFFSYRPPGTGDGRPHTGLGLAIVKAIVEAHGGTVLVSNAPQGGAVFEVYLPLA